MRCSNGEWVPFVFSGCLATYHTPFPLLMSVEQRRNKCNPIPLVLSTGFQDGSDAHYSPQLTFNTKH